MESGLKVLLVGDYSNCHFNLFKGLNELGCKVTLICTRNDVNYKEIAKDSKRQEGKLGGLRLFLDANLKWHKIMKGHDIVAINDPNFFSLKPVWLKPIFERLINENDKVFYTAMSIDVNYLRMCSQSNSPLRYSEFFINGKPSPWYLENPNRYISWLKPELVNYQNYVFKNLKGGVAVLYEYYIGLQNYFDKDRISYGGIPINTSEIPYIGFRGGNKIRILLCKDKNRIKLKGTDLLEKSIRKIKQKYPDIIEIFVAENLPYKTFIQEMKDSDIVLDQVFSYSPATSGLLGMAMGKTIISGAEPQYYDFINEKENHPIINSPIEIEKIETCMEQYIFNNNFLKENAIKSRQFVEKHNDIIGVASRFLEAWTKN